MIRKDLNSQNQYDAGLALSGLSCFISPDLARDLVHDIMTLLTSTKPYLRKKAVLMMYKVFLRFPEALRPAFPRLKEKLEDPDSGVQSAAVNVVCELARKNPKNYLSLAPVFFKLMTTSTNNWMLIKIIKLVSIIIIFRILEYWHNILPYSFLSNMKCDHISITIFIKTLHFYDDIKCYFLCTDFFLILRHVDFLSRTQFSTITLIEPKLGRRLTQPLIDLISRFCII